MQRSRPSSASMQSSCQCQSHSTPEQNRSRVQRQGSTRSGNSIRYSPHTTVQYSHSLTPRSMHANAKVGEFNIKLDGGSQVYDFSTTAYFTGQLLTGEIVLNTKWRMKVRRVIVEIIEEEKLGLMRKQAFLLKKTLFPQFHSENKRFLHHHLNKGSYSFPLELELPANLLPSIDSGNKYIKYFCRATIVRYRAKNSISTDPVEFDIYQDNPNTSNVLMSPQEPEVQYLEMNSLTVMCTLNKTAFCLGDETCVHIQASNSSRKSSARLYVNTCLAMRTHISGDARSFVPPYTRVEEVNISRQPLLNVPPLGQDVGVEIATPVSVRPTIESPRLSVSYVLRVKIQKEKQRKVRRLDFPVLIGWVPESDDDSVTVQQPVPVPARRSSIKKRNRPYSNSFPDDRPPAYSF